MAKAKSKVKSKAKSKKSDKPKIKAKAKGKAKASVQKKTSKPAPKAAKKSTKPIAAKNKPSKASVPKQLAKKIAKKSESRTKVIESVNSNSIKGKGSKPSLSATSTIHPLADRLVVKVEGPSERTAGGLYIPSTVEDRPFQGEVLATGQGSKSKKGHLKPLDVKKGEWVIFNSYAGVKTTIEGQEVLILKEEDVLGVLSK